MIAATVNQGDFRARLAKLDVFKVDVIKIVSVVREEDDGKVSSSISKEVSFSAGYIDGEVKDNELRRLRRDGRSHWSRSWGFSRNTETDGFFVPSNVEPDTSSDLFASGNHGSCHDKFHFTDKG